MGVTLSIGSISPGSERDLLRPLRPARGRPAKNGNDVPTDTQGAVLEL